MGLRKEGFKQLIEDLYAEFEKDEVCVETVLKIMSDYKSDKADWMKYAKFDRHRYTRNLVDEGNGKFNLIVLCWSAGQGSPIHDHAEAHCFMKMLKGTLCETRFSWPSTDLGEKHAQNIIKNPPSALKQLSRVEIFENDVCYINDSLGLHRMENASQSETAISLHLYSPPFDTCSVFNPHTGQSTKAQISFWSKYGEKRQKSTHDTHSS